MAEFFWTVVGYAFCGGLVLFVGAVVYDWLFLAKERTRKALELD